MKVVFDTNVLVSAALLENSVSFQAFSKAAHFCQILTSEATFQETAEVFSRRKFEKYISAEKRTGFLRDFADNSAAVLIDVEITDCADPKDNKFLELAVSGNADYIISGDNDLLQLHPYRNISIITPSEFLKLKL